MDKKPPYFRTDIMREVDGSLKSFGHEIIYADNVDVKYWIDSGLRMLALYREKFPQEKMHVKWRVEVSNDLFR